MKDLTNNKRYQELLAKEKSENFNHYLECKNVISKAVEFISDIKGKLEMCRYNDPINRIKFMGYLTDVSYAMEKYNDPSVGLIIPEEYLNFDYLTKRMSDSYRSTFIKNNGFYGTREYTDARIIKEADYVLKLAKSLNKAGMYICIYPSLTKRVLYKEFLKHTKENFAYFYHLRQRHILKNKNHKN